MWFCVGSFGCALVACVFVWLFERLRVHLCVCVVLSACAFVCAYSCFFVRARLVACPFLCVRVFGCSLVRLCVTVRLCVLVACACLLSCVRVRVIGCVSACRPIRLFV